MKRTNEEKQQKINEACELFKQANDLIIQAKKLLESCNIQSCHGFHEKNSAYHTHHVLLYKGIMRLSKILEKDTYFGTDYLDKVDKSSCLIEHNGIVFEQIAEERKCTFKKFTFN